MYNSLLAQGLRVTELLLEAVGEPRQLGPALHALTTLMDADAGMLASGRRRDNPARAVLIATRHGSYTAGDADLAFPAFPWYRRWGLLQPAGRLHRDADIRRLAQEHDGTEAADAGDASPGERCMAHIDAGDDSICYVGFARHGGARFDAERISLAESLMPHLRQAYAINRRYESMRAVSAAVMNRFERYHVGVTMVAADGTMRYCNGPARRIFEQADGLRVDADGRIAASDPAETLAMLQAVCEHLGGDMPDGHFAPRLLRVSRTAGSSPFAVALSPYRGASDPVMRDGSAGHAVMLIYNPDRPPVERTDVITQLYDLNPRESALVCAIAAGESLEDIARASKRSLEAVRSQLKRVFRKTGTSRQTELVKLVLSGPAAMVQ
jgi:DNA-binding CsgD family transcriptional regulator